MILVAAASVAGALTAPTAPSAAATTIGGVTVTAVAAAFVPGAARVIALMTVNATAVAAVQVSVPVLRYSSRFGPYVLHPDCQHNTLNSTIV